MDNQTRDYYKKKSKEIFSVYNSCLGGISKYFSLSFPPQKKVLDIGAGSGRDMLCLLKQGYDVYGVEPCRELRNLAITKYPELSHRLIEGNLPVLGKPFGGEFDGILCSAVIMHVPKEQLFDSVFAIRSVLKKNGRLLLSIPLFRPDLDYKQRDKHGRLFIIYDPDYLQLLFERIGFQLIGRWNDKDSLGRENHFWITLLFQLETSQNVRPIDQIECILTRDRKTATYKLALFRALCDIAVTNFHRARWEKNGIVGVPVDDIVEKWICYYWPIVESLKFLPQIRGELKNCKHPIAFRPQLNKLINYYKNSGGLYRFTLDYRSSTLNKELRNILGDIFKIIRKTIVKGPVTYAGGALETGRVFTYDSKEKMVLLNAEMWRELSLMGHWVNDALLLRWAELTSEISNNSIKPSEIIDLLLTVPIPERDIANAKKIYSQVSEKECVWSGKTLSDKFDVDHVIPFSLWRNNDLWNLLPVNSSINRNKSDKLPTHNLLTIRKDCIINYWRILRSVNSSRFDYEVSKFVGIEQLRNGSWELKTFNSLLEAVEVTAIQRGCERWEP